MMIFVDMPDPANQFLSPFFYKKRAFGVQPGPVGPRTIYDQYGEEGLKGGPPGCGGLA